MTINKEVISAEIAVRLKIAGYPQDKSEYRWFAHGSEYILVDRDQDIPYEHQLFAAPSLSEMGEQLPKWGRKDGGVGFLWSMIAYPTHFSFTLEKQKYRPCCVDRIYIERFESKTEVNGRGLMLVFLWEHEYEQMLSLNLQ